MHLKEDIYQAFIDVQRNLGSEMRFCQILEKQYKQAEFDEFVEYFLNCLKIVLYKDLKNIYVEQILCFAATFSVYIAQKAGEHKIEGLPRSEETHPFLKKVFLEVLKMQGYSNHNVRFHACNFIAIILEIIGNEDLIDENLYYCIQAMIIDRLRDIKAFVRIKAIATLFRLQDPKNDNCPVAIAFLDSLRDPNAEIRKSIIEKIAPSKITIPKILESLGDISEKVRVAAFVKCSLLPPSYLMITQRQEILRRGFEEECSRAKKTFTQVLIPKWLSFYDTDFLLFLKAIKLDADEEDIQQTSYLCYEIMKEVFQSYPIVSIIKFLPINEDKIVPIECLSSEIVLYWSAIQQHITLNDDLEYYLEQVLPDLSPFCAYIERVLSESDFKRADLIEWRVLENQFIIYKLFEMAGQYDLGDEVGRIKLHQLVLECLAKHVLTKPVISTLIKILGKLNLDANSLIEEVNELIDNIQESKSFPSLEYTKERTLQLQKLNEEINQKSEDLDAAINRKDMTKAFTLEEEIKTIISIKSKIQGEAYVCDYGRDLSIQKKCLDILICLLGHEKIKSITPTLQTLRDTNLEFVSTEPEIISKTFQCFALCSLIDYESAKECLRIMWAPINLYKKRRYYDRKVLLMSIYIITDLLKLYGAELFAFEQDEEEEVEELEEYAFLKSLIEEMMNMLDDENQQIREHAAIAISQLFYNGIMVSDTIFARILLKWYSPTMEISNPKGQQLFGIAIENFVKTAQNSHNIVIDAIVPILKTISRIPANTIDVDNLIKFIAAITQFRRFQHVHLHNLLNQKLCNTILEDANAKEVGFFIKMLLSLQIPEEKLMLDDIKKNIEAIIRASNDMPTKRKLNKYLQKLEPTHIDSNKGSSLDQDSHCYDSGCDYTIQDTDESIGSSQSYTNCVVTNSDHEGDDSERALLNPRKKIKLMDENFNAVIENEADTNEDIFSRRN